MLTWVLSSETHTLQKRTHLCAGHQKAGEPSILEIAQIYMLGDFKLNCILYNQSTAKKSQRILLKRICCKVTLILH